VAAGFSRPKPQNRTEYLRVRLQDGQLIAHMNQSSGVLSSAVWADGFAQVDAGQTVAIGQSVLFLPYLGLLG
jgi:molybdopterin molybdotransferase